MAKKASPASIDQTARGKDNVQVEGSNITVEVNKTTTQFDAKGQLEQRNRHMMLDYVENFWVKGILEESLYEKARLELGIKKDFNAVNYPWGMHREPTDETLPAGKSMLEIFQEIGMGRSLLILGAPGSGKTTMLLELARRLIQRARQDETEPIPVVFLLSSWKEGQRLSDWLAEQLNRVYYVPKKIAPVWVNENRMSLLLDGLDEVQGDRRVKCVEAINEFRKEHGFITLAVCSRIEEYSMLKTKLSLEGAITLQPLDSQQVNEYLERFGRRLASVKQTIKKDKALRELARTPLMLSIMALAYKDKKAEELRTSGSLEEQRKHLFDTYIASMFERSSRVSSAAFTKEQTLQYLSWLARTMIRHNVTTYQIEAMQPSWLGEERLLRLYRLTYALIYGLIYGLIFGLLFGLAGALIIWLGSWRILESIFGPMYGLSDGLPDGLIFGLINGVSNGLLFGLSGGIFVGLSSEQAEETTYPAERLKQSLFSGLLTTLIFGLLIGIPVGLLFSLLVSPTEGLMFGLMSALVLGPFFGLIGGLMFGLIFAILPPIRRYSLRFILARRHLLPPHIIPFLEHCVDLIFLQRVGGSYIFVHRLLMEHFAEMEV